jgi:non-catalytic primase subunit PriX-like protein
MYKQVESGLDFILRHFTATGFPRNISTKTTEGKQLEVNSKEEALARFKQADYLDCRISAYSKHDIKGDPNFIFIDIDSLDRKLIDSILHDRLESMKAHPTVLFTGNGYHIYVPIDSVCLDPYADFASCEDPNTEFLRFAEKYISRNKSDPNHYPSFKSCMVRVPGSINSKTNSKIQVIQEWDGNRPHIKLMLGSFYAHIRTMEEKRKKMMEIYSEYNGQNSQQKRRWIEENLLKTGLDDYRKNIVNLVLAPYLINVRKLPFEQATNIILQWLDLCRIERPLDFNARTLVDNALRSVKKSGYKPMSLSKLKQKNSMALEMLWEHLQ